MHPFIVLVKGNRIRTRINLEAKEWVKFEEGRRRSVRT